MSPKGGVQQQIPCRFKVGGDLKVFFAVVLVWLKGFRERFLATTILIQSFSIPDPKFLCGGYSLFETTTKVCSQLVWRNNFRVSMYDKQSIKSLLTYFFCEHPFYAAYLLLFSCFSKMPLPSLGKTYLVLMAPPTLYQLLAG